MCDLLCQRMCVIKCLVLQKMGKKGKLLLKYEEISRGKAQTHGKLIEIF